MHATLALSEMTYFPDIQRQRLETLQVNLGYKCNQHCHVNAGSHRTEMMDRDTLELIVPAIKALGIKTLDLHCLVLLTRTVRVAYRHYSNTFPASGRPSMKTGVKPCQHRQ